jgi:hypothetical protein
MRPIRYIGRNRNAGFGHSRLYRLQMECALYIPFGYLVAPAEKKRKWEADYNDSNDDRGNAAAIAAVEAEIAHFDRLCQIERG